MRINTNFFHIILFFIFGSYAISHAQTKLSVDAENQYREENYKQALVLYRDVLKSFPTNAIYKHRYGVCLFETHGDLGEAEKNLSFAASKGIRLSNFYLAQIKFMQYEFEDAKAYYATFKNFIRKTDPRQKEIEEGMFKCDKGLNLIQNVEDITITDTITVPFKFFYLTYDLSPETGVISNRQINKSIVRDSLFMLYLPEKGDRCFYNEFVNETTKNDLFKKDKLLDVWSDAKPLNSINTRWNEIFPFLLSDGLTIYFSSDRPESFGGYDIFVTRYSPSLNEYLPPQPLGMPFNSYGNDYLYVIDEFKNTGWFASDRHAKPGFVTIYKFKLAKTKKMVATTDKSKLRSAALLKVVRSQSGTLRPTNQEAMTYDQNMDDTGMVDAFENVEEKFEFIVNDTTVYHTFKQFKNRDAITTYKQYLLINSKSDSLNDAISKYRQAYENEADVVQQKVLANQILSSEDKIVQYAAETDSLERRARKLEIDALEAYGRMKTEDLQRSPWKPKPLEIDIPKRIVPTFYNPYLNENYTEIFTPYEIDLLKESERKKLMADNLVLDWQEILMKINKNPNADRIIVEKLILRDSAFAEPMTVQELAYISEQLKDQSTEKYFEALSERYEILNNKVIFLSRQLPEGADAKLIRNMLQEADFQFMNAVSKTTNFTEYKHLNFDQLHETTGLMESSNDILERAVIVYRRAIEKPANTVQNTAVKTTIDVAITYKVQVGIFKNKPDPRALAKIPACTTEKVEGTELTRYFAGEFTDKDAAEAAASSIERAGFPGAFVVPYVNGVKSSWNEIEPQKIN